MLSLTAVVTGQVLGSLGFGSSVVWEELGKLIALAVGFRFIAYLVLLFGRKERLKLS